MVKPNQPQPPTAALPAHRDKAVRAPGLGFVVGKLSRRITWALADKTLSQGVMPAQFPVLRSLNRLEVSTQTELARLCGIEQPTMAATLARMEKADLITRKVDANDGRKRTVTLTPHGRHMLELMTDHAHDVYDQAIQGLTDAEIETFLQLCGRMTDNLERAREANAAGDAASMVDVDDFLTTASNGDLLNDSR